MIVLLIGNLTLRECTLPYERQARAAATRDAGHMATGFAARCPPIPGARARLEILWGPGCLPGQDCHRSDLGQQAGVVLVVHGGIGPQEGGCVNDDNQASAMAGQLDLAPGRAAAVAGEVAVITTAYVGSS